jgi:hypothetical protein
MAALQEGTDQIARVAPILVTGIARSGTSWVGKMLQASGEVVYLNEPLNVRHPPGLLLRKPAAYRYQCITKDNEAEYLDSFLALLRLEPPFWSALRQGYWPGDFLRAAKYSKDFLLGRIRGRRALLKDPLAVFSIPWFSQRLGCDVVAVVRHPAAVVDSHKRLSWRTDFRDLLAQRQLCEDYLGPFVAEMKEMLKRPDDMIGNTSLLWRMVYHTLAEQKKRMRSIEVVRYEDLALDPVLEYQRLYLKLGLSMDDAARQTIENATSGNSRRQSFAWSVSVTDVSRTSFRPMNSRASVVSWKKSLSEEEVSRIRSLTEDVADVFYSDQDWAVGTEDLMVRTVD